jgi:sensor histidine kinase YesM
MVRNYLDIELVRFADRLTVSYDIDEKLLDAMVPAFALQPFVENAIIHGISRLSGPGYIRIAVRADGGVLHLSVMDNGPGPNLQASRRSGIGLTNLRARLETLYGAGASTLSVSHAPEGGAVANLTIPLRTEPKDERRELANAS